MSNGSNSGETLEEELTRFFRQEKYRELILQAVLDGRRSVPVDFTDLMLFDGEYATKLCENPREALPPLNTALRRAVALEMPNMVNAESFTARIRDLPESEHVKIREIRAEHLHRLISTAGVVVRASVVQPVAVKIAYRCRKCGKAVVVDAGAEPPESCDSPRCMMSRGNRARMEPVEDGTVYEDFQVLGVQEMPEELPPGQLPRILEVRLSGDLVDRVMPGDRVVVVGILLTENDDDGQPSKVYVDAVSVEPVGKGLETLMITPEEERMLRDMAAEPGIYQRLIDSIAPSVKGLDHIKESILLALVGGRKKVFPDGVRVRGDVHVLLVGDPGTAKSTLLLYAAQIAPRGVYASGRGSTAAGLTAAVVKEANGGLALEAGASVLADMGVCVIDEIDKMRPEDRVAMHEVMAQQTVSVAKGGIVATLNARCSILAAANPEFGRYDIERPFNENVNLPVTLTSRFDLIFVLRDQPSPVEDQMVSSHIVSLHVEGGVKKEPPIPPNILKKYIAYSKKIEPVLTQEAAEVLQQFYLSMRAVYKSTSTVSITARQLESLIRLAEARARALLRDRVTVEDAEVAISLMRRSLSEVGVDVESGKPDIDVIMTGKPSSVREKMGLIIDTIKRLCSENEKGAEEGRLIEELKSQGIVAADAKKLLARMVKEGIIFSPEPGYYRTAV